MIGKISAGLTVYAIVWFVFAIFDFDGSDTIVAYQLRPSNLSSDYPELISVNPTTYRITCQTVVSQTLDFEPRRYTDCAVLNIENWTCTYSDGSGKFGFRDGDYYSEPRVRARTTSEKWISVSRFEYVLNGVKWALASNSWFHKVFVVLLFPFFK